MKIPALKFLENVMKNVKSYLKKSFKIKTRGKIKSCGESLHVLKNAFDATRRQVAPTLRKPG